MRSKIFSVWILVIMLTGLPGMMSVPAVCAAPSAFNLLSPADKAKVSTKAILDWEDSSDSEGLTYTVYISESNSFGDPIIENLSSSFYALQETDGIKDVTTYYWKVEAINGFGAVTGTSVWQFTTDNNSNAPPARVGGVIYNSQNKPIPNATVTISKWGKTFTFKSDQSGAFIGELKPENPINPGTEEEVTLEISADGYDTITASMKVVFDALTSQIFTLDGGSILIGDIDNDGYVKLKDAILVLRVLTGEQPEGIVKETAMSPDKVIGLEELIYILKYLLKTP
jgi:hypothetical protein